MEKEYSVGVIDSGVGGTTVLKEILKELPNENILYYGDSGNAPYGDRTIEDIQYLCRKMVSFLVANKCKAVVIACNTATVAAQEILEKEFDIPIIGVVSAGAKGAVAATKNKKNKK